jgi:hypothetical protein
MDNPRKLKEFYGRWFTLVNQVIGDQNIREFLMNYFKIEGSLEVVDGVDGLGVPWQHHIAIDLKTNKQICSVYMDIQNADTEDTACQSYSLYNTVQINRLDIGLEPLKSVLNKKQITIPYILHSNHVKIADFLLSLLKIPKIRKEINQYVFINFGYEGANYRNNNISNIIPKLIKVLKEWKDYGYKYFLIDIHAKTETCRCSTITARGSQCSRNAVKNGKCAQHNK